jgi:hypothetical protein
MIAMTKIIANTMIIIAIIPICLTVCIGFGFGLGSEHPKNLLTLVLYLIKTKLIKLKKNEY